jgi:hypothetical protein
VKAPLENSVVRGCLQLLKLAGIFAWRQNNAPVYDRVKGCYRAHNGMPGISDIIGVLPDGRFLAVECKRKGRTATDEQKAFLSRVTELGGMAMTVSDVRQLQIALQLEGLLP